MSTEEEPKLSVAQISSERKYWVEGIKEEFDTLNQTCKSIVDDNPSKDFKLLPSGVILKIERDEEWMPARFKAHLVVHGNFQTESGNEHDLNASVACIKMVRFY